MIFRVGSNSGVFAVVDGTLRLVLRVDRSPAEVANVALVNALDLVALWPRDDCGCVSVFRSDLPLKVFFVGAGVFNFKELCAGEPELGSS